MFIICDFIDIISYVRQFTTQYKKQIYDLIEGVDSTLLSLKNLIICCQNKDMTYTKIAYRK